jgi:hypothetical protein
MGGGPTFTGAGAQAATAVTMMMAARFFMPLRMRTLRFTILDSNRIFFRKKSPVRQNPKENGPVVSHRAILWRSS